MTRLRRSIPALGLILTGAALAFTVRVAADTPGVSTDPVTGAVHLPPTYLEWVFTDTGSWILGAAWVLALALVWAGTGWLGHALINRPTDAQVLNNTSRHFGDDPAAAVEALARHFDLDPDTVQHALAGNPEE